MKSAYIQEAFIEKLKEKINISDVVGEHVTLRRNSAICPFHAEKTASFSVEPNKGIFKCFSCGATGDAISFLEKYLGVNFIEAVEMLADKYNMEIEYGDKTGYSKPRIKAVKEAVKTTTQFYMEQLKADKKAYEFAKSRGITDTDIEEFQIGYAPQSKEAHYAFWKKNNTTKEELIESGLIGITEDGKEYLFLRNRLVFPIKDHKGDLIAYSGRAIDPKDMPKYKNTRETVLFNKSDTLYNFNRAFYYSKDHNNSIIITEGFMDVIALNRAGFRNAVATMGVALSEALISRIKKANKDIFFFFDGDKAGQEAMVRIIPTLLNENVKGGVILAPSGKDPDDALREDKEFTIEAINKPLSFGRFLVNWCAKDVDKKNPDSISKGTTLLVDHFKYVKKGIAMPFLRLASALFNIPTTALERMVYIPNKKNEQKIQLLEEKSYDPIVLSVQKTFMVRELGYLPIILETFKFEEKELALENYILDSKNEINILSDRELIEVFCDREIKRAIELERQALLNADKKLNDEAIYIRELLDEIFGTREARDIYDENEKSATITKKASSRGI